MEQVLADIFEQARKLVADADRKLAEEDQLLKEKEREGKLMELAARIDDAFDFTSKEKLELDPRLDLQNGKTLVEFVVRSQRAIFALEPREGNLWALSVLDDGREPQPMGEIAGGTRTDVGSRRLAAARIVTSIGNWAQKIQPSSAKPVQPEQPRWQDAPVRREPSYGTFGKFLGY